jgi:uncharacterized membrane protein YhaH (DUF805 family)
MTTVKATGVFVLEALRAYGLYLLVVVVGTGLLMLLANSLGYSTYGDRPGTGWFGFHPNLSLASVAFLSGFVLFTAELSVLSLFIPASMLATAGLRRTPLAPWALTLILVPLFGFVTYSLLASAGWYIALDPLFIYIGTLLSVPFSIAVSSSLGLKIGRFRLRAF